ncbi:MAG: HAD family hydrolase, partial [Bacteroidaceae bacterium]|nr:HAD family hydrolase [Bacteroidaceae bacterium]
FDRILTSEDFTASKPAPDCYLLGARVLGADISESVVFEDAFNGLAAGMAAGIFTIGLTTNNPAEAIRDKCNYVIPNFIGLDYNKLLTTIS